MVFVFTLEASVPSLNLSVTFPVCLPFVRGGLESSQLNLSKYFSSFLPGKHITCQLNLSSVEETLLQEFPSPAVTSLGVRHTHCCLALDFQLAVLKVSGLFFRTVSLSSVTISFHLLVHMLHCILGWPDTKRALCLCMRDSVFSTSLTWCLLCPWLCNGCGLVNTVLASTASVRPSSRQGWLPEVPKCLTWLGIRNVTLPILESKGSSQPQDCVYRLLFSALAHRCALFLWSV